MAKKKVLAGALFVTRYNAYSLLAFLPVPEEPEVLADPNDELMESEAHRAELSWYSDKLLNGVCAARRTQVEGWWMLAAKNGRALGLLFLPGRRLTHQEVKTFRKMQIECFWEGDVPPKIKWLRLSGSGRIRPNKLAADLTKYLKTGG